MTSRPSTPSISNTTRSNLPNYERSFHDKLDTIQSTLLDLKNNRKNYISLNEVYEIYDSFLSLLHELKLSRKDEELKGMTLTTNSNDLKIDDIWQLLSLCFVTCGLIKFAPATYSSLLTVSKLLGHLKECQVYTLDDLRPIKVRLAEIRDIITYTHDEDATHKSEETLLLLNKLNKCETLYKGLEDSFRNIPHDLEPIYNKLISIRKSIMNYFTNEQEAEKYDQSEIEIKIEQFKRELKEIEEKREEDGRFHSENDRTRDFSGDSNDPVQPILNGLIDDCNNLVNDLVIKIDTLSEIASLSISEDSSPLVHSTEKRFESLYTQLIELKHTLENLLITRRWTMRETDLYTYQKLLKAIDDERIDLNKTLTDQNQQHNRKLRKNHILILYLLRRCYSLIYKLLESSESVSESLQPIHNQLSTVRRCLLEIKRIDGLNSLRDLYPFQMKLASLDNLREDGKFTINNQIPEGQGTLNALLAECFDIMHELQIELEDKDENDDVNGGDFTNSKSVSKKFETDEVEIKRKRYGGFIEADYDKELESGLDDDYDNDFSEAEGNDYY